MSASILTLPEVTLVTVTSVAIEATAQAVARSISAISFGEVLWLSDGGPPAWLAPDVTWVKIDPILSREAYSRFMLQELHRHVSTAHALCIQWDGYVLNPGQWDPAFLLEDYIGAVWPQFSDGACVGNGGFSLRSRKLLEACGDLPHSAEVPEDVFICRQMRPELERKFGIRFASPATASRFAFERTDVNRSTFGFHGSYNLVRMLRDRDAARLIESLPIGSLAANEHREIFVEALRTGKWRLVWEIVRRIRRFF